MKATAGRVVLLALLPAAGFGQSQVELSVGGGVGSNFTRREPFVFDGLSYVGPYRTCPEGAPALACTQQGFTDVTFGLETNYGALAVVGLEARRGVGGSFLAGAGVLGGLAIRQQRLIAGSTGQVVEGRTPLTQELSDSADNHAFFSTNGVGTLAYVHGGLRWDRGFESRTPIGYRTTGTRVFLEAGGGLLAALPGGGLAGVGHPPAIHGVAGLTIKRTSARPITLSLRYVRALRKRDDATLVASRLSWVAFQVGWLIRQD